MQPRLTLDDARDLDQAELIAAVESMVAQYDAPEDPETHAQQIKRLSRTLDEIPQVYRWLLQLRAWCDHWTDSMAKMFGQTDRRYKRLRQRRDFFDGQASAAKMRYEAASRQVTVLLEFEPTGMPRHRKG